MDTANSFAKRLINGIYVAVPIEHCNAERLKDGGALTLTVLRLYSL